MSELDVDKHVLNFQSLIIIYQRFRCEFDVNSNIKSIYIIAWKKGKLNPHDIFNDCNSEILLKGKTKINFICFVTWKKSLN